MTSYIVRDNRNLRFSVFCLFFAGVLIASTCGMLKSLDSSVARGSHSQIPVQEKALSASAFINSIGVNTHLSYFDCTYGNFALVKQEVRSIGIRHLRDGIHLQDSAYNAKLYDRWIELGRLGIRFDAVVDPRNQLGPVTPALLQHIEQLAGNTIESFEGPNELDISGMADWVAVDRDYQKDIFSSVQSLPAPRPLVIAPSLAFVNNGKAFGGNVGAFDEGNLHPYPAGKMPSVVFSEQLELARTVFGDKPIAITESGYHNAINDLRDQPAVSEPAAAKYIPRLVLENFTKQIARTYLYELFDVRPDPGFARNAMHWGLVRADGTEKPAFVAVKNLIQELNDIAEPKPPFEFSWTLSDSNPAIHHLLLKKSNGLFDLVLWQEVSSYSRGLRGDQENPAVETMLIMGKKARRVTLFEPVLQEAPLKRYADAMSVRLSIPDHPLVVEIEPE
jgi:hypothetical protein